MDSILLTNALEARDRSYSPYSGFKVGAALLDKEGHVFTGCNVENASYGLTVCAERTALFKAISEGKKDFVKILVVADELVVPCGACLQVMAEFSPDIEVVCSAVTGESQVYRLSDLLPKSFTWSGRTK